ncbi:MAG: hypothetical protein ACR2O4_09720, partial [Hyphomicrobiaceae bacterium]
MTGDDRDPRTGRAATGRPAAPARGPAGPEQQTGAWPHHQEQDETSQPVPHAGTGQPGINPALRISQPANDPRFPPAPDERARLSPPGAANPQRRRFKWLRRFAVIFGVLVGIGLVATAALQIRLNKGTIEIPYLVASLEDGLSRELGENRVRIGALVLYRSERSGRIEFRLQDLRLVDASGATVARAPAAAIDLSRNAFFRGVIAPKRIELIRPRLVLSYDDTAGISLRFAGFQKTPPKAGDDDQSPGQVDLSIGNVNTTSPLQSESVSLVDILKDAFKAARERKASTSFLKHIGIRDAVIVLRTRTSQTVWSAPQLGLALRHQRSRSIIRGQGTLSDGKAPWEFAFEIDDTPARGAFQVRTIFKDLVPGEFGRALPALVDLQALETPLSGQVEFHLAEEGSLAASTADIVIGAGYLRHGFAEENSGILFDEGHAKFDYSAETR